MGKLYERNQPCPSPKCGSSDAFQIYIQDDGTFDGYCFSCNHYTNDPYDNKKENMEVVQAQEIDNDEKLSRNIESLPSRASPTRGHTSDTTAYFGVKTELSPTDGTTVTAHYYPVFKGDKQSGWKVRKFPKEFYHYGDARGCELFGQQRAKTTGAKRLFITEGEEDAMALHQALVDNARGTKWDYLKPAVVSLPHGASSAVRDLSNNIDFIKGFQEVVLVFDMDEPGRAAVKEALKLLPTALVAELEEKDANEMVLKGKASALCKAVLFNSRRVKPASIVSVDDVYDRAIAMPTMGLSWPWDSLTKLTYGIHRGKLYGLGAGVGIGKTDWAKELQNHLVNVHKMPVGVFMLEEPVGRTLKGIAGKFYGKQFHKPDGNFTQEELKQAIDGLKGKVWMYDHFGTKDWSDIKSAIRYMVVAEGVKDIFLDHMTALVAHVSASEANDLLNTILSEVSGMANELDFSFYYLNHLNPPQNGPPHERGGHVHESQFTGSRAQMKWSHYLFGIERNKDPELPEEERNTSQFILLKDREFGQVGKFDIYYDPIKGTYLEPVRMF